VRRALILGLFGLVAMGGGCIDELDPDTGAAVAPLCGASDSDPGQPTSFASDVAPILAARCKACHFPDGVAPIGLQVTGLDLSTYATVIAGATAGPVVVAGQPCSSVLFLKVSPGPPFGGRMPLNGPPFLTDAQIQVIHDWIAEGALAD
jgi:hypothetical protein